LKRQPDSHIIVALAFVGAVLVYHVLVKPTNITRFLFAMRFLVKKRAAAAQDGQ